jgi:septal ring factor EnvC (AmiA/AmiB activator)
VKELDGIKAAKDSELTRKDREISGLVAAAAKSQTRVQDLEEANATISEFCSTLEETGDSCRATIELLRGQLAELEEELREARATKNRRRVGWRVQRQRVSTDVPALPQYVVSFLLVVAKGGAACAPLAGFAFVPTVVLDEQHFLEVFGHSC